MDKIEKSDSWQDDLDALITKKKAENEVIRKVLESLHGTNEENKLTSDSGDAEK
jgi:hypothetical protein